MNTPTLISLPGTANGTAPKLPGQMSAGAEGTFADSLSMMLAGAQAQPLLPVQNPVASQAMLLALGADDGNAVSPGGVDGGIDMTAPLLDTAIGASHGLADPNTQSPGSALDRGLQNASNVTPADAKPNLPNPNPNPNPGANLTKDLDGDVLSAAQLALMKTSSSLQPASLQQSQAAIAVDGFSVPDDLALPDQTISELRHALSSQIEGKSGVINTITGSDQRGQERSVDPATVALQTTLRPMSEKEAVPQWQQSASSRQMTGSEEGTRGDAPTSVQVKVPSANGQNALNPAAPFKVMMPFTPQQVKSNEFFTDSLQPTLSDAEQIDIFGSEIGRVESVGATSSKSQVQQAQPPQTQIALQIAKAIPQGIDRLSVQLHPAELGAVQIQLDFAEDGHVSALITAERPETLDLLQRDSRALAQSLSDTGLELENGGLSFSLQQEQHQQGEGFNASPERQSQAYSNGRAQDDAVDPSSGQEPVHISQRLLDIST